MPKKIDLTNNKFGEWTVLREATKEEKQNKPGAYWLCQCSCGKQKIINGQVLRENQSKSCGCKTSEYLSQTHSNTAINMSGEKYGRLKVIGRDFEYEKTLGNNHQTQWKCECECGNITTVGRNDLINNKVQSCGCLRKEIAKLNMQNNRQDNSINEIGNRYGKLVVLYQVLNDKTNGLKWHCKCDCGNEINVLGQSLRNGNTKSCGCIGRSAGEWKIEEILLKNNISFSKEYCQKIQNKNLRYDFAIFNNKNLNYLIEFDGRQHFESSNLFGGEQYLKYIQEHDIIKNQWCKENNIPLIRIPYTHLNNLCLEDLLLETSQFIV